MEEGIESNTQELLQMRLAQESDEETLLIWRNFPDVVIYTQIKKLISPEEHHLWYRNRMKVLNQEPIFIFDFLGSPIGMTRLEYANDSKDTFYISVLVDSNHRGKGFGLNMIKRTTQTAKNILNGAKILAVVSTLNLPSIQLFERSGFKALKNEKEFRTYEMLIDDKA